MTLRLVSAIVVWLVLLLWRMWVLRFRDARITMEPAMSLSVELR
ncbi:MAG: hypothetical protein Q8K72_03910 [Acidimicrobiales bacterium]|nr:hypothetical protein [Acidimicrobiales bacterium]